MDGAAALALPGEHRTAAALLDSRGHVHVYATDRPRPAELCDSQAGPRFTLAHRPCAAVSSCHSSCCSVCSSIIANLRGTLRANVPAGCVHRPVK